MTTPWRWRLGNTLFLFTSAYNVGDSLVQLQEELIDLELILNRRGHQLRVLAIDDKSTDNTLDNLISIREDSSIRNFEVLANNSNLGNTANIEAGYKWALRNASYFDFVATMDSDGEHSPLSIVRHLDSVYRESKIDGVIGSVSYPEHLLHPTDRKMMPFLGQMQAELAQADGPFTLQSPGMQLWKMAAIGEVINTHLPAYREFLAKNNQSMPRWGLHGVIAVLASLEGASKLHSVYLECFKAPPDRDNNKRLLQANACLFHQEWLQKFTSI